MSRFVATAYRLDPRDDKAANVERALSFLDEAVADSADFAAFPEMTTFIGPEEWFTEVTEALDGPTIQRFSEKAREHGVFAHTGSFFERIPGSDRVYNMLALIGPNDEVFDTYRKVRLFDIEPDGSVRHREPDYAAPGDRSMTTDIDLATFGFSIYYDLRFLRLYRAMA